MKKILLGIISTMFIMGAGTAVFAANEGTEEGIFNFEKMKPLMQEMHPDFSDQELEDMYNTCHGAGGGQGAEAGQNMMNRF